MRYLHTGAALGAVLLATTPVVAQQELEEIVVTGRSQVLAGEARTASEGVVGQMDLAIRPLLRPGDVLEAVPGLIVTQHSGSGKSNQMFLRGFNLDHGTDFSTSLDGMPVNMRTHGHGQGYLDLNFIIPELDAGNQTINQRTFAVAPGTSLKQVIQQGESVNEPECLVEGVRRVVDREVCLHFHRVAAREP